jgi:predicted N-acetyltransferase YhbS
VPTRNRELLNSVRLSNLRAKTIMFQIRKMEPKDYPLAAQLANTMNWSMTAQDFVFNSKLEPNGSLSLFENAQLIGAATCISYGKIGWFGNLIVEETHRNKGAGTALLNHAVKYLKNKGTTTIGLYAYPHLNNFYSKAGFKSNSNFAVLKTKKIAILPQNQKIHQNPNKQHIQKIVEFDRKCFGASRRKLLETILNDKENLCFVYSEKGEIQGYCAAKIYEKTAEVGPLVSLKDPDLTKLMLQSILSKLAGFEAYMYIQETKKYLIEFAIEAGFKKETQLARMFLGSAAAQDSIFLAESLERG